jgi:hypothetical protein
MRYRDAQKLKDGDEVIVRGLGASTFRFKIGIVQDRDDLRVVRFTGWDDSGAIVYDVEHGMIVSKV